MMASLAAAEKFLEFPPKRNGTILIKISMPNQGKLIEKLVIINKTSLMHPPWNTEFHQKRDLLKDMRYSGEVLVTNLKLKV